MAADMDQESLVRRELTSRCIAIVSIPYEQDDMTCMQREADVRPPDESCRPCASRVSELLKTPKFASSEMLTGDNSGI